MILVTTNGHNMKKVNSWEKINFDGGEKVVKNYLNL